MHSSGDGGHDLLQVLSRLPCSLSLAQRPSTPSTPENLTHVLGSRADHQGNDHDLEIRMPILSSRLERNIVRIVITVSIVRVILPRVKIATDRSTK